MTTPGAVRRRQREIMGLLFVVLALLLAFAIYQIAVVNPDSAANRTALCALRADRERQVEQGKQILRKHPHGVLGLTPAQIRAQLAQQQGTVDALSVIDC